MTKNSLPRPSASSCNEEIWADNGASIARSRRSLVALRACVAEAERDEKLDPVAGKRLKEMLDFTETIDGWAKQMLRVPRPKLTALIRLGSKIANILPLGRGK